MYIFIVQYAFLIFSGVFCYVTIKDKKRANKSFCIMAAIFLLLLMALRHQSTGIDIVTRGSKIGYYDMFMRISQMSFTRCLQGSIAHYETGYIVFCKLLSYISRNPQILLISCATIQSVCLYVTVYKTSKMPFLTTIMYLALPCYYIFWSGLRQGIAISITMIAFLMIKEKKPIKFILLVVLAWLFHSSAIIFLIAYPLYHLKRSSILNIVSCLLIPVVYLLRNDLFEVFSKIFKDDAKIEDTGSYMLFLVFVIIYIFLLLFTNPQNKLSNGCTNLFWFACLVQSFSGVYGLAMRVGYYFMIYFAIAIPEILFDAKSSGFYLNQNYKNLIKMLLVVGFVAYGLYTASETSLIYQEYSFFWR